MVKNSKKTKVSIVILTINSKEMLKGALENISSVKTNGMNVDCIVVDNGSTDGTKEEFQNYQLKNANYKFIETDRNLGFAGGNNVAFRKIINNDGYTVVLNDDIILPEDFLIKSLRFMDESQNVGASSPKIYFAKGFEFHRDRYKENQKGKVIWYAGGDIDWKNIYTSHRGVDEVDSDQYSEVVDTDLANGACMIVRNEVFRKVGLLDEGFYLYWEDADFCQRVKKQGYRVTYNPDVAVWHKVSASSGGPGNKSNDYFLIRNRYYFAMRYATLRTKFAVFRDTVRLSFFGRDWQKLGAKDALMGKKGAGPWVKS